MSKGMYEGRAVVEFLPDGRRVRLGSRYAYIDPKARRWDVPKGAIVDGASIPRPLWTLMGGPFEGKYRNASIIHDWYCDLRSRPWKQVHRMFYDAMITSGVSGAQARLLYAGVYFGGPRWSKTVIENVALATGSRGGKYKLIGRKASTTGYQVAGGTFLDKTIQAALAERDRDTARIKKSVITEHRYLMNNADLQWLESRVADQPSPALSSIEKMVDARLASRTPRRRGMDAK